MGVAFGVNRTQKRSTAFLTTVIKEQQWQIGDSLLNFKFGSSASEGREARPQTHRDSDQRYAYGDTQGGHYDAQDRALATKLTVRSAMSGPSRLG
jgi:hypothetical protein